MAIEVQETRDVAVVALEGKLMGGPECDQFKTILEQCMDQGFRKVVIDFNKVEWANSSGIGAVIACYLTLKRLDGELKFARLGDRVRFYLNISKLDTVFEVYDSVNEAVTSF